MPARVDAKVKAGLLTLIDDATSRGWSVERAAGVLRVDVRRLQRWRIRSEADDGLDDAKPGGGPLHAILDTEEAAVLEIIEQWGVIDRSHRKLAHRGSYLRKVWVSPSTVRRIIERHGLRLPKPYTPRPTPVRDWPDAIVWEPNRIWIWDSRQFTRADRHVVVIMDVVSRKWIDHIVTPEFTATQTVVLFRRALAAEQLADPDTLADTAANQTLAEREPVLLAWSDNGTQMKAETTRQFMALAAIWQHHGRPHTPTDQAYIESFFSHLVYDWPHLDHIDDPVTLNMELARIRLEYNTVRLHAAIGYVTPNDEHTGRGTTIRQARARGLARARRNRITHNRRTRQQPPEHTP